MGALVGAICIEALVGPLVGWWESAGSPPLKTKENRFNNLNHHRQEMGSNRAEKPVKQRIAEKQMRTTEKEGCGGSVPPQSNRLRA